MPPPPLRWYIQSSTGGMPARLDSSLRATRYVPSGVQAALRTYASFSEVRARGFFPSASMSQMFSIPPRSLVNAIVRPSGESRGW